MYIANAHKRTQRSKSDDSPVTAGAAGRVPRVGVNKSDLEAQGTEHGWTARPLTYGEVMEMPSSELRWHEQFNAENLNKVFAIEETKKTNGQNMAAWRVKLMWAGQATEEENQKAYAAGDRFALSYSQFIRSQSNCLAIAEYMLQSNLDATRVESYIEAYEHLVPLGKLVLSPKAAGIGPEETLTGDDLRRYARLNLLLQPNKALRPDDKLSADEWFALHKDTLADKRTPPLIAAREARANATAAHFAQAEASTAKSGSTAVTDYPEEPSGYLTHSKYNFRKFVAGLSAVDFQEKLNDPTFVAALDRANDGNK